MNDMTCTGAETWNEIWIDINRDEVMNISACMTWLFCHSVITD